MASENARLEQAREQGAPWKKWGPYLSERQWGTVREDYSENGDAWNYFTHDQARSRAYRWGEDGLAGISDDKQRLCFALALWNGKDPILKERLFGLTNSEGNHGEDVKEYYFYLDSTPTHSYMKYLYKYPQAAFPYADLVETNRRRTRDEMEYELLDTGVFDEDRYFDVFVEYAKAGPEDILIQITAANRGPEAAELHVLPTLWFRNDWAPGSPAPPRSRRSRQIDGPAGTARDRGNAPRPGGVLPVLRRRCAAALHRERNQQRPAWASITRTRARTSRTASTTAWSRAAGRGESGAGRDQGRGALPAERRARPSGDGAAAPHEPAPPAGKAATAALREGLRRDPGRAAAGGGRVLPLRHPALGLPGCRQRDAPGPGRHALVQAVLLLRRRLVAGGARRPPAPPRKPPRSGTGSGSTWSTTTSSRCRTSGSTPGTRPGTWPSTRCRSRSWTPTSPRSSWT